MSSTYYDSPFGPAVHAHVNKPDDKFKPDNPEFKVDLKLSGKEALAFKEKVDAQAEAAFENFKESERYAQMKPKDQRELAVYYPYEEVEDDDGNKTGDIIFFFKQNQKIKLRDGTTKEVTIGIYDAKGKEMDKLVRSGSEVRVKYSFRPIPMPQLKLAGIRLDFMSVQVKKLAKGNSGGGFGAVEGYEDDGSSDAGSYEGSSASSEQADY